MKTQDAVIYFGSQAKLAKALGINPSAVTQWGDDIPQRRQYEIERLTGGRLKADAAPGAQQGEPMTAFISHITSQNPDDASGEMIRLAELVAHLALLIEDMERVGNKSAELSLRVQYHQAMADLLQSTMQFAGTFDARSEGLRQRHVERAVEYQHELDRLGTPPA